MPEPVVTALINAGILGPILIAVGWYVLQLQRKLDDAQGKRVEDAQRVAEQLLELNDRWAEVVGEQANAFQEQKHLIQGVSELLKELRSALRPPAVYPVPAAPPPRDPGGT